MAPSSNYADLLRGVPGMNITQISARDVNVNSRSATSSLATSQLAVVDGRSIYQDFFGFTMWDFMPSNLDEIKRIEVIRGPASAVWGANALNGVINVITKSPREMLGHVGRPSAPAAMNREVNDNGADSGIASSTCAARTRRPSNDRWSYKVSARHLRSDALRAADGPDPERRHDVVPELHERRHRQQPKFDVRVDYDFADPEQEAAVRRRRRRAPTA